jgi:PAS domain S-box-containing protein
MKYNVSYGTLMVHASGISDKPKAEKTPRKPPSPQNCQNEERRLRIAEDILESIDDYISAFDRNWNFIFVNRTTANGFGYNVEELLGKNLWETFSHFVGTELERNYREAMSKREIRRFEWKTLYAHAGYREFTVFPSAEGITVYGIDITERKLLQQKIDEYTKNLERLVEERTKKVLESEQSYRELYESFDEAFIATDWELNVIH